MKLITSFLNCHISLVATPIIAFILLIATRPKSVTTWDRRSHPVLFLEVGFGRIIRLSKEKKSLAERRCSPTMRPPTKYIDCTGGAAAKRSKIKCHATNTGIQQFLHVIDWSIAVRNVVVGETEKNCYGYLPIRAHTYFPSFVVQTLNIFFLQIPHPIHMRTNVRNHE